ncbi:MAG: hypothetical protein E3K40_04345 [Candidatus Brocadia sp.]|nr:hypothetical protein [Candidatus Brocadia sp.]
MYEFNQRQAREREERIDGREKGVIETKEEARQRLLFARVTMQAKSETRDAVLFAGGVVETQSSGVSPESISPGEVPLRLGGKKPTCFFALLKSFLGTTIIGFSAEPEGVPL